MVAQWNIQQALETLQMNIDQRFDTLEARHLTASIERAELEGRVANLEEKATWIGAGFGASLLAMGGLFVAWVKVHWLN